MGKIKMNIDKITTMSMVIGILLAALMISFVIDTGDDWDDRNVYCYEKYGKDYATKWDVKEQYPYCSAILNDGTISKYYFYREDAKGYCEEKFWKFKDCPIER